ncbi:AAA family ATPase, partial [Candidatus Woesearchaeota archaeon]|nr:AAA family ATPase [Candidatus Woesearchaeota archaeon]
MEWYEELDYEENPFKDNQDTELLGYQELLDEVIYRLESGGMVCVEGKSGAGKTAVLNTLFKRFKGTGKLIYLNGQQLSNGLNIEKVLNKKGSILNMVLGKKPKNMVLLLDEVQDLSKKNCERIKYYYDNNYIKSVVFTSSDFKKASFTESLKDRLSKTLKLRDITEDEAVDVVHSRLGSDEIMPEEVIREVFNISQKNMKTFLKNCERLCAFLVENNGKIVHKEHITKVLGQETSAKAMPKPDLKAPEPPTPKRVSVKGVELKEKLKKLDLEKQKPAAKQEHKPVVESEPVTITIVDDFRPVKKEEKMEA